LAEDFVEARSECRFKFSMLTEFGGKLDAEKIDLTFFVWGNRAWDGIGKGMFLLG
jgi:hypothetical protein